MNLQEKIHAIANYYGMNVQICKLGEEGAELAAVIAKKFVLIQSGELAKNMIIQWLNVSSVMLISRSVRN